LIVSLMFVHLVLVHQETPFVNPLHLIARNTLMVLTMNASLHSHVTSLLNLENNVQLPLLTAQISHIHLVPLSSKIHLLLDVVKLYQNLVHLISVTLENVIPKQTVVFLKLTVQEPPVSLEFVP
jgi:hypothetical protein